MNMLAAVLPMVGFFLGIGVIFAVLHFYRWLRRRRLTRSPFTEDFLNPPGKSLRQQIDGLRIDLLADMFGAVTAGTRSSLSDRPVPGPGMSLYSHLGSQGKQALRS